jgi:hypothetical protein
MDGVDLEVRLHRQLPVWRIIRLDRVLYGAFRAGFHRLFDDLWDGARPGWENERDR